MILRKENLSFPMENTEDLVVTALSVTSSSSPKIHNQGSGHASKHFRMLAVIPML